MRNSRKGLINIKNKDNKCFLWRHNRHLNPLKNDPQRVTLKDKELVQKLNYRGVTFPVRIKDISKIEKQNKININVFGYSEKITYPIWISAQESSEKYDKKELNLLRIEEEGKDGELLQHYVLMTDFNRFNYNYNEHKDKK